MALPPEDREELRTLVRKFKRQSNTQVISSDTMRSKSKKSKSKTSLKISEKVIKDGIREAVLKYLKEKVEDADGRIVERGELILGKLLKKF